MSSIAACRLQVVFEDPITCYNGIQGACGAFTHPLPC